MLDKSIKNNSSNVQIDKRRKDPETNPYRKDKPYINNLRVDSNGMWDPNNRNQPIMVMGNSMSTEGYGNMPLYVQPNGGNRGFVVPPNVGTLDFGPGVSYFVETPMAQEGMSILRRQQIPLGTIPKYNLSQDKFIQGWSDDTDWLGEKYKDTGISFGRGNLTGSVGNYIPLRTAEPTRLINPYVGADYEFNNGTSLGVNLSPDYKGISISRSFQEGGDYNMQRALELGYEPDETGHWPSADDQTGMWLKSKQHPSAWMEYLYGYALNPEVQRQFRHPVINPEGYFGNDQLQYLPKEAYGGLPTAQNGLAKLYKSKENENYKIRPQKEWLENWINHPEFQKRLQTNLDEINQNKSFLVRDIPYSFPFTYGEDYWKNKAIEKKQNVLKRLGSVKDFYTEGYDKNDKLINSYYKHIFPNDPKQAAYSTLETLVTEAGGYHPSTHSIIINSPLSGRSTPLHEYTHSTGLDYLLRPLIPQAKKVTDEYRRLEKENPGYNITYDIYGDPILSNHDTKGLLETTKYIGGKDLNMKLDPDVVKYINKSSEVYPRIMQLRYENNIKPGEKIDNKKFKNIKNTSKDNTLFDIYNDDEIMMLMNKLANVNKNQLLDKAAYGGDPSLTNITGHYKFGGKYSPTETHMETGGWLEKLYSTLNPYNWGVKDYTDKGTFNKAYESAKKAGEDEFMFSNKRYNTKYAGTPRQEVGRYGVKGKPIHPMDINHPAQVNLYPALGKYLPGHIAASIADDQVSVDYSRSGNFPYGIGKVRNKGEKSFNVYGQDDEVFLNKAISLPTGNYFLDDKYIPSDWNLFTNNCADNVCDAFGIPRSRGIQTPSGAMDKIKKKYSTLDVTGRSDYEQYLSDIFKRTNYSGMSMSEYRKKVHDKVKNNIDTFISVYYSPDIDDQLKKKYGKTIQEFLRDEGYELPKSQKQSGEFDGVYGPETRKALEDYQTKSKKKNGGWLDEYAPGGNVKKPNEPIYVTDPNDPRLKAYQDSLYANNLGEQMYQNYLIQMRDKNLPINKEAMQSYDIKSHNKLGPSLRGLKPIESRTDVYTRKPASLMQSIFGDDRPDYYIGPEVSARLEMPANTHWEMKNEGYSRWKKPVQPYILKEPKKSQPVKSKVIKPSMTKDKSGRPVGVIGQTKPESKPVKESTFIEEPKIEESKVQESFKPSKSTYTDKSGATYYWHQKSPSEIIPVTREQYNKLGVPVREYGGDLEMYQPGGSTLLPVTSADSAALYKNTIDLLNYYGNKQNYKNLGSRDFGNYMDVTSINRSAVNDMRERLKDPKKHPYTAERWNSALSTTGNLLSGIFGVGKVETDRLDPDYDFKLSDYYQKVDPYKYKQRELANYKIDTSAPMQLYDTRIKPTVEYTYQNVNESSGPISGTNPLLGDIVNFYGYDPKLIKPWSMLTPQEKAKRMSQKPKPVQTQPVSTPRRSAVSTVPTRVQVKPNVPTQSNIARRIQSNIANKPKVERKKDYLDELNISKDQLKKYPRKPGYTTRPATEQELQRGIVAVDVPQQVNTVPATTQTNISEEGFKPSKYTYTDKTGHVHHWHRRTKGDTIPVTKEVYDKLSVPEMQGGGWMNNIQLGLDAAQFIPVLGEAAYIASLPFTTYDVGKDLYHGDLKQAGIDALGYIPGLKAFKYGVKGEKLLDTTSKLAKQYKKLNTVVNTTNLANDARKKEHGGEWLDQYQPGGTYSSLYGTPTLNLSPQQIQQTIQSNQQPVYGTPEYAMTKGTGRANYIPVESLLLPASLPIKAASRLGKAAVNVAEAINPISGLKGTPKKLPNNKVHNSILENFQELQTVKNNLDLSPDDIGKLEGYLDDVYDYKNLTPYEKRKLLDRETYHLSKDNISVDKRIENNKKLLQNWEDYKQDRVDYFNSPKFRERVDKQYGQMTDKMFTDFKQELLQNLEKRPYIRPDVVGERAAAHYKPIPEHGMGVDKHRHGHTYYKDEYATNPRIAYHEGRHQLTNAEDEFYQFPSETEIREGLKHPYLLKTDKELADPSYGADYFLSTPEYMARIDELKRDLSKVGYDYKTMDLTPELLKKYRGLNPKEAVQQITGKPNVRLTELSDQQRDAVQNLLESNPSRTDDTDRLLRWFKDDFLINTINNKWGLAPVGVAAGAGALKEEKQGGQLKLKRRKGTSQNIQSSVNDLFMRNELLYGPPGKRRFVPYKEDGGESYKTGGWLDNYV